MMLSAGQFSPASLFAAGEQGAWYDPSDFSTMFQDSAGTTPVTAVEQPVGLILDKSKGLALGSELVTNGTFDTNTTGWTLWQTGILSVDNFRLKVENGAATISGAYQLITVVVGRTYKFEGVKEAGTALSPRYYLGTSVGGTQYASNATSGQVFIATSTTLVVTAATQSTVLGATAFYDNISVKELAGNHASQSTSASRPVLSARVNLLTYSEQFDNAAWTKPGLLAFGSGSVANATAAPDGTITADLLVPNTTLTNHATYVLSALSAGVAYTASVYAKVGGYDKVVISDWNEATRVATFDLTNVTATLSGSGATVTLSNAIISSEGNGWYRCSVQITKSTTGQLAYFINSAATYTGDGTSGIYIWGADLRVTNDGVGIPAYQRVAAATDYDTSGFPLYLKFDGTDDSLATASVDFSATDKMSVFAGVRKLSDAAVGVVLELSTNISINTGSVLLYVGTPSAAGAAYSSASRGSTAININQYATIDATAPDTAVLTGTHNIAGDLSAIRRNGVSGTNGTGDQGTGNFGNYPLYIGRRAGTSVPYNGRLYSLIVRGAQSTDAQIASTETWVNGKTKAY
jgi:hypothetical protein